MSKYPVRRALSASLRVVVVVRRGLRHEEVADPWRCGRGPRVQARGHGGFRGCGHIVLLLHDGGSLCGACGTGEVPRQMTGGLVVPRGLATGVLLGRLGKRSVLHLLVRETQP